MSGFAFIASRTRSRSCCSALPGGRGVHPPPQLPTFREAAERTTSWAGGRNAAFFPS